MKEPLIGIIGKLDFTNDKPLPYKVMGFGCNYLTALDKFNVNYIGIMTNSKYKNIDEEILKLCDGFLFQGGSEIRDCYKKIVLYAYNNKIPVLGICLGMQIIGTTFSNYPEEKILNSVNNISSFKHAPKLNKISDRKKIVHKVVLKENSTLYKLFGSNIEVNSRHKHCLNNINYPLEVTAYSEDGIIEGIELIDKKQFMIGVQWHPENIKNNEILFKEFIRNVFIYYKNK